MLFIYTPQFSATLLTGSKVISLKTKFMTMDAAEQIVLEMN